MTKTPKDMDTGDIIRLLTLLKADEERHLSTLRSLQSYAAEHQALNLAARLQELSRTAESQRREIARVISLVRHPAS